MLAALPLVCVGRRADLGRARDAAPTASIRLRGVVFGIARASPTRASSSCCASGSADLRRPARAAVRHDGGRGGRGAVAGIVLGEADLVPTWPSVAWLVLLALSSQVLGWMLITVSLPRLPAAITSVTLTIQPVGSLILGAVLLGE